MRIVHAANFNTFKYGTDFYSTDRKITTGFVKNGHFVYDFSCRDILRGENLFKTTKYGRAKLNQKLLLACCTIKPDLLMLGHSELIDADMLEKIKKDIPGIRIGMWYVDSLFHTGKETEFIHKRLDRLDAFFATTGGEHLKTFKKKHNRIAFFPNIMDGAVETYRNFEKSNFSVDFVFCGRDYKQPERRQFLSELFNAAAKNGLSSEIRGALGNKLAFGDEYMSLLARSKMGLNYSHRNDVFLYSSDRIVQLTGNGILTFSPKVPGMNKLYSSSELVYFNDLDDLIEKIIFFSKHDEKRIEIAKNGWLKTHGSFNSSRVTKFMEEVIFNKTFSDNYEWKDEVVIDGKI